MIQASTTRRRGPAKTLEQQRQAKARKAVVAALTPLFCGLDGHARQRLSDAALEVAKDLHIALHGAQVTCPKLSAMSGREYPFTRPKVDTEAADAVFRAVAEAVSDADAAEAERAA